MPYVIRERRDLLDPKISDLAELLKRVKDKSHSDINAGDLNYVVTTLLLAAGAKNYAALNELVGMLECCKQELYRKLVTPYEELKEKDNGPVYPMFEA